MNANLETLFAFAYLPSPSVIPSGKETAVYILTPDTFITVQMFSKIKCALCCFKSPTISCKISCDFCQNIKLRNVMIKEGTPSFSISINCDHC